MPVARSYAAVHLRDHAYRYAAARWRTHGRPRQSHRAPAGIRGKHRSTDDAQPDTERSLAAATARCLRHLSGEPTRETMLWGALLRAGPGAVLSHQTAAERHGLVDEPSFPITITVPVSRHPAQAKIQGIVIHRSDAILRTRHPAMLPPCTRVEDTVLDLIQVASNFDDAYAWICRAIGRRRTTADRIHLAMDARKKMRWRGEIAAALGSAAEGILSVLEHRYVRRVERPHGLPPACRQAGIRQRTGNRYLDNLYEEYQLCVELDGTAAHPADEQWRDKRRDTDNAVRGILTLRFGILDVGDLRCQTAAAVASVLRSRGWPGTPHPCRRPACAVAP